MMPNADEMVRELHVRTVQFVHKQLSAAKPVSEEAKGVAPEEQSSQMQQILSIWSKADEENSRKVEVANQDLVTDISNNSCKEYANTMFKFVSTKYILFAADFIFAAKLSIPNGLGKMKQGPSVARHPCHESCPHCCF